MPLSFALNSAASESYKCDGRSTGECCSSLHSDSRVLVPVSLPSDESKRRDELRKESFLGGIDKGFDRSIELTEFSNLDETTERNKSGELYLTINIRLSKAR